MSPEVTDIYSRFNDPALPLTGVDDIDWAEIDNISTWEVTGNRLLGLFVGVDMVVLSAM